MVYLHGFADIHAASADWMPFHHELLNRFSVVAPAHPGCAQSDERDDIDIIDDVVFHYVELFDALELERFSLVGSGVGGWIAAEMAVRYPERVIALVLIGATGLYVPGVPISDLFWYAQPDDGVAYNGLRHLLFAHADTPIGCELFPDSREDLDLELRRFKMFRFANTIGFKPPYLYNRKLRGRLRRYRGPSLVLWGAEDHLVPLAHAEAYATTLPRAHLELLDGVGHSVVAEQPTEALQRVQTFLLGQKP
ncbi:alpha/beta fold hydrolase [Candidatus Entotheonella palauensis]|uniref:alpha/beta fold hydrolase n=1 Tax=Candidatus Entotheonella palauensis TaxID=93172 RepID=UPI002117C638|nr:alpha/beta hydrolase [Candidatus Entotheonella palauensis]